jgi:uncharacterized SAM-binding protein YcdF (DUF218 family)
MADLFFIASKTAGMAARAESWLLLGLLVTLGAIWRDKRRLAHWAGFATFAATLALTIWPLGDLLLAPLEGRYPVAPALDRVDGIIVLGGAERTGAYRRWGTPQFDDAGERVMAAVTLAARFPRAQLIFTGGQGAWIKGKDGLGPSRMTRLAWTELGVASERIVLETASRNTAENARLTLERIAPAPGQRFVLVTSAFHMPRAMQSFARAGWTNVTAWPVDFRSGDLADGASWRLDEHLSGLDIALKEYLGLLVYQLTGR